MWTADGAAVVVGGGRYDDTTTLHRIDVRTRRMTPLSDVSLTGLWRLPSGRLAGWAGDVGPGDMKKSFKLVVTGPDGRGAKTVTSDRGARSAVTAAPAGGWAQCPHPR